MKFYELSFSPLKHKIAGNNYNYRNINNLIDYITFSVKIQYFMYSS